MGRWTMGKRALDEDDNGPPDDGFLDEQMITLFGQGPKLSTKIPHPIVLDRTNFDYRLGLKKFQMYNSIPNIVADGNNCLSIRPGGSKDYILIQLDTGAYEMTQINNAILIELQSALKITDPTKLHFTLGRAGATFKGQITLSDGWAVDFNVEHSIAKLIGFTDTDVLDTDGIHKSKNEVQIQGGFDSLLFLTNITYPSILNGRMVPYIYHYSKNSPPWI